MRYAYTASMQDALTTLYYHVAMTMLPRSRYLSILLTLGCLSLSLSAGTAFADAASVEAAEARILEMEGDERLDAQQRFMATYRDQSGEFLGLFRNATTIDEQKFYVWALGETGSDSACDDVRTIATGLDSEDDPTLLMSVANASARCGEFRPLRSVLGNGAAVLRAKSAIQLGLHGDTGSIEAIRELANDEEFARYSVFFNLALGMLGDDSQTELMREMLRQVDARVYAAIALGRLGDSSVAVDLQMALRDREPSIRLYAIGALVELRVRGTDSSIRPLLNDPDPRVRQKAEWAMRRINRAPRSE